MVESRQTAVLAPAPSRAATLAGAGAVVLIAVVGLTWAKWHPYLQRLDLINASGAYPGSSIFDAAGARGAAPSLHAGWEFTRVYMKAIWPALVVGLVLASAIQAFLPRRWLTTTLAGRNDTVRGGALALPSMMCTCCTAPVAVSLRRHGASVPTTIAYWLGNPLLNPAVIVFMAVLLPWSWVAVRIIIGAVLVFVVPMWVNRAAGPREEPGPRLDGEANPRLVDAPGRFVRELGRLTLTLLPEYVLVVFAVGALSGWLFPFAGGDTVWLVLLAAVLGTLVVIPTAGEIPILQGLAAAGAGPGLIGALLIALPAVSLPSMAMVSRTLTPRVTLATAGAVACASLIGGLLLVVLA
jgi:uncharacterized membrane protein YraQ (UPF0718 family)